ERSPARPAEPSDPVLGGVPAVHRAGLGPARPDPSRARACGRSGAGPAGGPQRAFSRRATGAARRRPPGAVQRHRLPVPAALGLRPPDRSGLGQRARRGARPGANRHRPRRHPLLQAASPPRLRGVLRRRPVRRDVGGSATDAGGDVRALRHRLRTGGGAARPDPEERRHHGDPGGQRGGRRRPRRRAGRDPGRPGRRRGRRGHRGRPRAGGRAQRAAADQGRLRGRAAAGGLPPDRRRVRRRGRRPAGSTAPRPRRALGGGGLRPARPARRERRRLRHHRRLRRARLHPALDPQRRRPARRGPAAAGRRRRAGQPLHRRRHPDAAGLGQLLPRPAAGLRRRAGGPGGRHRRGPPRSHLLRRAQGGHRRDRAAPGGLGTAAGAGDGVAVGGGRPAP
ncbi:MAG: Xaa-Pro aminopeptidase, partial [uncultured Friedmanniella sp.]